MAEAHSLTADNLLRHGQSAEPLSSPVTNKNFADFNLCTAICFLKEADVSSRPNFVAELAQIETQILERYLKEGVACNWKLYNQLDILVQRYKLTLGIPLRSSIFPRSRGVHSTHIPSGRAIMPVAPEGSSATKPITVEDAGDEEASVTSSDLRALGAEIEALSDDGDSEASLADGEYTPGMPLKTMEYPAHRPRYVAREERVDKVTDEVWHADSPNTFPFGETRFIENYIGWTFGRDLAAAEARGRAAAEESADTDAPQSEEDLTADLEPADTDISYGFSPALYDLLDKPRYTLPALPRDANAQYRKMEEEGVLDEGHLERLEGRWDELRYCSQMFDAAYGEKIREVRGLLGLDDAPEGKGKRKAYVDVGGSVMKKAGRAKV